MPPWRISRLKEFDIHERCLLLCPAPTAPHVLRTGDVMHDNALHFSNEWQSVPGGGPVLLTLHRPQNVDDIQVLKSWIAPFQGGWQGKSGRRCFPSIQELGARWRMKCLDGDDS